MTSLTRPRVEFISTILQSVLNLGLLCLGLILIVFLGKANMSWWKGWWFTFSISNLSH